MRSFDTDRPTKSNIPYTVDAGHLQYEMDIANDTYSAPGTSSTDLLLVPNPTLKIGLTGSTDFELNFTPYERVRISDRAATSVVSGFGDMVARLKVNLWGDNGGSSAMALIPYVKIPTARPGIGNGAVEGGLIAPLSLQLLSGLTLLINSEVDALRNAADDGYHVGFLNLVNLSREVHHGVTVYAEIWSDVTLDPGSPVRQVSADTAVAWSPRANLQLDMGLNAGLNRSTPGRQLYLGASQRF